MIRVLLVLIFSTLVNAEILEVKQLFNKKIVTVKSVELATSKTFYANTALDESKVVDVTLRFSGFVEKIYADKSFISVNKGETLFSIYSKTLSEIKAEIDLAKEMRQKTLIRNLQKKLSLLNAGSRISSDFTVDIKAPISGIILEKNINQGSFIKSGMLVYKIADMSQMWVKLEVYQKDIGFVKVGMPATIMIDGLQSVVGKVDFIAPFINAKTKKSEVRVVVENPARKIYPNMFAKVLLKSPSQTLLTLPKSAVLTKGAKHFVFKPVGEDEFEPVEIVANRVDAHTYTIESGVKAGDRVIDRALFMLDADAITNGLYDNDDDEDW
ncbi:MAG TPA: efflux RND transporter periplasmic adaptor subunit [Campylobacterales bacterium]|nr:efflux RND transporter periplasmic adaptor subunit [Campylobacterales bacterium]